MYICIYICIYYLDWILSESSRDSEYQLETVNFHITLSENYYDDYLPEVHIGWEYEIGFG